VESISALPCHNIQQDRLRGCWKVRQTHRQSGHQRRVAPGVERGPRIASPRSPESMPATRVQASDVGLSRHSSKWHDFD